MLDFTGKNDRSNVYISFCNIVLTLSIHSYTSNNKINQHDIFTQEVTSVEIGQMVAKGKLLIVACITDLL